MKTIFIGTNRVKEIDLIDFNIDDEFFKLMSEYKVLESHVVYFSAGEAKIKEILVQKEPTFSL